MRTGTSVLVLANRSIVAVGPVVSRRKVLGARIMSPWSAGLGRERSRAVTVAREH